MIYYILILLSYEQYLKKKNPIKGKGLLEVFISDLMYIFPHTVRSCPPLSRPKKGFLRCSNTGASNRTECQVGCERGYRLEGPSRLTCQANSLWSGPQPRCVGKPSSLCTPPSDLACYSRGKSFPLNQTLPHGSGKFSKSTWVCSEDVYSHKRRG